MRRFHQIAAHARSHDAIGAMALRLAKLAKDDGLRSLIFTEGRKSFLGLGPLRKQEAWEACDVALYHHSIGSPSAETFLRSDAAKRVLLYHNITPPELAGEGADACRWGLEQLPELVHTADVAIGLSELSLGALREAGAASPLKLPYLLGPGDALAMRERPPLVLFVGRIEPFKGVYEAFEAFEVLSRRFRGACFAIVGDVRANPRYAERLRLAIRKAGLASRAKLLGRVSDPVLKSWYKRAGVFLTLSSHEGFCVPLVEAMRAGVPVVARRAGAIPETLGEGGILVDSTAPDVVAAALETALLDAATRRRIDAGRQAALTAFEWSRVAAAYRNVWSPSQLLHN